ncbi:Uncharacterised protein [Legionella londiniensis]|uniref:Uncharacterized protein n=1 Tax=Legionella londiniensis TaxID=45068 RepID=A0A0W0VSV6_9GAMM|nr:hypothetical protein Llon_0133 [Legionella londiniensis]STX93740.1 Uncharacterised protein [Legionella londiniensis]
MDDNPNQIKPHGWVLRSASLLVVECTVLVLLIRKFKKIPDYNWSNPGWQVN